MHRRTFIKSKQTTNNSKEDNKRQKLNGAPGGPRGGGGCADHTEECGEGRKGAVEAK
ncbi:hypothetical protein RchiOBHm_Chr1g0362801 [Rosa chinensis]|uniref:Uncharacterized protein n=1 Tax=Rosa chinensis TaxID=74649 RepID=A0A2P6SJA0_ROSCH|nr:hypothetical protein RchiOBHm_Chr1g0362801 [Rosa chinensis]